MKDYIFTFPTDDNGDEVKWRFMLTLRKPLNHAFSRQEEDTVGRRLMKVMIALEGIDNFNPSVGRYTVEASIARTFDPEQVIAELEKRIKEDVLSEIIKPRLVTP